MTRLAAYAVAGLTSLLLIALFARALPDAAERAKDGYHRVHELACEALRPTDSSPVLGTFPQSAPDFTLKDYAGRDVTLSSLKGNVVLVSFWATWCKTCVVEMPSMEKLVAHMKGRPFRLLAVSVDEQWDDVRRFFAKGTVLDILLDPARTIAKRYGTEKFPETFIVDKDGTVRYFVVSDRDWTQPDVAACLDAMVD